MAEEIVSDLNPKAIGSILRNTSRFLSIAVRRQHSPWHLKFAEPIVSHAERKYPKGKSRKRSGASITRCWDN